MIVTVRSAKFVSGDHFRVQLTGGVLDGHFFYQQRSSREAGRCCVLCFLLASGMAQVKAESMYEQRHEGFILLRDSGRKRPPFHSWISNYGSILVGSAREFVL